MRIIKFFNHQILLLLFLIGVQYVFELMQRQCSTRSNLRKKKCRKGARRFDKNINFIDHKLNRFIRYYNYDRIHLGIGLKLLMKCCT